MSTLPLQEPTQDTELAPGLYLTNLPKDRPTIFFLENLHSFLFYNIPAYYSPRISTYLSGNQTEKIMIKVGFVGLEGSSDKTNDRITERVNALQQKKAVDLEASDGSIYNLQPEQFDQFFMDPTSFELEISLLKPHAEFIAARDKDLLSGGMRTVLNNKDYSSKKRSI